MCVDVCVGVWVWGVCVDVCVGVWVWVCVCGFVFRSVGVEGLCVFVWMCV